MLRALAIIGLLACSAQAVQAQCADTGAQSAQAGDFSIGTEDCGTTFIFSSTSQATVTANAASSYPDGFWFSIVNNGNYTGDGSARGLMLSGIMGAIFRNQNNALFPGQKTEFTKINGTWVETGYEWRQLWKPAATVTWHVDCGAGSDSNSDGLSTGAGANATIGQAEIRLTNFVDYSAGASQAVLSSTGNCPSGDVLHLAGPLRGSAGNAALVWNGNGTTTVNGIAGAPCAAIYNNAIIEIIGLNCVGGAGGCFTLNSGAVMFFLTTRSTCDPGTSQGFVAADPGSKYDFVVGFDFGAAAGRLAAVDMFSLQNGGYAQFESAQTINFLGDTTFSQSAIVLSKFGSLGLVGTTFNANGHAIRGLRFICQITSILNAGSNPNAVLPGDMNGSAGPDCQSY